MFPRFATVCMRHERNPVTKINTVSPWNKLQPVILGNILKQAYTTLLGTFTSAMFLKRPSGFPN